MVNVQAGYIVDFLFNRYYNDGSNWVAVDHVNGGGGAPSLPFPQGGCDAQFVFGAVPASNQAVYHVTLNGNPDIGLTC